VVVLVVAAILAATAPGSALVVSVFENTEGNTLSAEVVPVPFVEDGFNIAGRIFLTELWTVTPPRGFVPAPVIFSITTEPSEEGSRWEVNKEVGNQTDVPWEAFQNQLIDCSTRFTIGVCIRWNQSAGVDLAEGTGLPRTSATFPGIFADPFSASIIFIGGVLESPGVDSQRFFIDLGQPTVWLRQQPFSVQEMSEPPTVLLLVGAFVWTSLLALRRRRA